jgi:hypothetical protein
MTVSFTPDCLKYSICGDLFSRNIYLLACLPFMIEFHHTASNHRILGKVRQTANVMCFSFSSYNTYLNIILWTICHATLPDHLVLKQKFSLTNYRIKFKLPIRVRSAEPESTVLLYSCPEFQGISIRYSNWNSEFCRSPFSKQTALQIFYLHLLLL